MIRQQRILIITLAILFAVLLIAYFAVIRPMTADEETEEETVKVSGSETPSYGRILMFPQVKRGEIQSMEVHNEYGSYKFVRNGTAESDFEIEGYSNLAYNEDLFAKLVVATGYALVERVTEEPTEQQLIDYGFKGGDKEPAYYILTTTSGDVHKVTIGKKLISGGGYYAMYEGVDTIYYLDASLEETLLQPITAMVSPLLTAGIETTDYYLIDDFAIKHYGKEFITCRNLSSQELAEMETTALAKSIMTYPAEYSLSTFYDQTLQTICYYTGESVAALGLSEENLEKFGLKDAPYEISYEYGGYTYKLTASERTEDGYYYVATSLFKTIVKVPASDFDFLSWGLLQWIDVRVFSRNIKFVNTIEIKSEEYSDVYRLSHFEEEENTLYVAGDVCGEIDDIKNFREFYKTLLLTAVEDYAPEDEDIVSDENFMASFTVTTQSGDVTEYGFYRYTTRRALLTINGVGQFYVLVDVPEKMIEDAIKLANGIAIDAYEKN